MCKHSTIELVGQIAVGEGKTPIALYSCKDCRSTVVLRNRQVVHVDYRQFR